MSEMINRGKVVFVGLFAVTILAVMIAWPAAAEPAASSVVHLPVVTSPQEPIDL